MARCARAILAGQLMGPTAESVATSAHLIHVTVQRRQELFERLRAQAAKMRAHLGYAISSWAARAETDGNQARSMSCSLMSRSPRRSSSVLQIACIAPP